MKHLTQFEVDGKYYFDESVYEIGDYAIVKEKGAVWPVGTILRCLDESKNGLPAYFVRKGSKEEALQHSEYIQPLWIYNSEMIAKYLERDYQIRNQVNTTIPQDILVQLLKYHNSRVCLSLNSNKEIRVSALFHTGESKMYQIDNCNSKDQMYEIIIIENITKQIINKEYGKQHTTTNCHRSEGYEPFILCGKTTIEQGDSPAGRSCSTRYSAKIIV